MLAVALSTVLIPVPFAVAFSAAFVAVGFWTVDVLLGSFLCRMAKKHRTAVGITGIVASIGLAWLLAGSHAGAVDIAFVSLLIGLTFANAAGPFYLGERIRRREPLASGHLLWAWSALVWTVLIWMSSGPIRRGWMLSEMVGCAQLTLVVAVLLLIYGKRPIDRAAAETHLYGWVLVELQVILWGCYAARSLW